jgi:hypothetical protein
MVTIFILAIGHAAVPAERNALFIRLSAMRPLVVEEKCW